MISRTYRRSGSKCKLKELLGRPGTKLLKGRNEDMGRTRRRLDASILLMGNKVKMHIMSNTMIKLKATRVR